MYPWVWEYFPLSLDYFCGFGYSSGVLEVFMLGLGPGEIILIAIVVIVVVGPDRLPQFMRGAGKMYGQLRRAADEMRRALVLEADRQDAETRYQDMRRRRDEGGDKEPLVETEGAIAQKASHFKPDADEIAESVEGVQEDRHGVNETGEKP
jgi:Tat protein translocase TatB subunit